MRGYQARESKVLLMVLLLLTCAAGTAQGESQRKAVREIYRPGELYELGLKFMQYQDYTNALRMFERFMDRYKDESSLTPAIQFYIGKALELKGDLVQAVKAYETVLKQHSSARMWGELARIRLQRIMDERGLELKQKKEAEEKALKEKEAGEKKGRK